MTDVETNNPIGNVDNLMGNAIDEDVLNLKKEIAKKYVDKLVSEKKDSFLSSLFIGEGKSIEDFLVSEGIGDKISDKLIGTGLNMLTMFDTTTSSQLQTLKEKLDQATTKEELTALQQDIDTGALFQDPVVEESSSSNTIVPITATTAIVGHEVYRQVGKGKSVDDYLDLLTGGRVERNKAKNIVESQLVPCTFFGDTLSVNKYMKEKLEAVEKDIKAAGIDYPIKNAGTYNRRNITGGTTLSYHALGLAIDINSEKNPYQKTTWPNIVTDMPKELVDIFKKHGFVWGGNWGNTDRKPGETFTSDAMHFEFRDIDYLASSLQQDQSLKQVA